MAKARAKVEEVVKGGLANAHASKGDLKFFQGKADQAEVEKMVKPATLLNKKDHPITLSYGGESIMLAPRGREIVANMDLLGAIPVGVTVIPKI